MDADWLLSVDPGFRTMGLAIWYNGDLFYACDVHASEGEQWRGPAVCRLAARAARRQILASFKPINFDDVAFEGVEVYKYQTGKQTSLFDVYGVVCALATIDETPDGPEGWHEYKPREWTGERPKRANHRRIRDRLDEDDEAKIVDDSEHVLDAIGVGLYHLREL